MTRSLPDFSPFPPLGQLLAARELVDNDGEELGRGSKSARGGSGAGSGGSGSGGSGRVGGGGGGGGGPSRSSQQELLVAFGAQRSLSAC